MQLLKKKIVYLIVQDVRLKEKEEKVELNSKKREKAWKPKKKKIPLKNLLFFPNLLKIFPVPIIVPKISKEGESCYGNYSPHLPPQRTHL